MVVPRPTSLTTTPPQQGDTMSSTTPPPADSDGPEYLDQSGGDPVGAGNSDSGGDGRRTALIAGGAVVALALVGGGAWAAMSFFSTGAQPADALPAGTIGYASIDLDPSGGQKIEAFRMVEKFPAIEKELGGFDADDDILALMFKDLEEECDGLSYDQDIQPWLGYRIAVAAVDLGDDLPVPVGVVQVKDASAAEEGLAQLRECAAADVGGWVIEGDWAIVAETEDIAQDVTDAAADGTLADDETFQDWTGEVGDPGVMSMYAAPEAGKFLAELIGTFAGGGMLGMPMDPTMMDPAAETDTPAVPEEYLQALEDFQGMAATLRFDDGALEFEVAGAAGTEDQMQMLASDRGDDVITTLPEDTAVALGFGFAEGWLTTALEQAANMTGGEMSVEELEAEVEASTGLTLADLETLAGESAAISLGSEVDAETFFNSSDGSDIPIGAKVQGDASAIQDVLAKLTETMGSEATFVGNDAEGDMVAIGPNPDYRGQLVEDGGLGDSDIYQNVVRESGDANAIVFVNFDAGDWLTNLAEGDQAVADNLVPLEGLGFSSWSEDATSHAVFRLTTND